MRRRRDPDSPEIQIAPMIDCVFLMLVYFMTTSSLERSEADLACPAGQAGMVADPLPAVDEQSLSLREGSLLEWNGSQFDLSAGEGRMQLIERLLAFKGTCQQAGSEPSLRLLPEKNANHQSLVSLLDAISAAGIEQIHLP